MSTPNISLSEAIESFFRDMQNANRSPHTLRVYKTDLRAFQEFYQGSIDGITAEILRDFFTQFIELRPATRARKQASLSSFLSWALRQEFIQTNPLLKLDRVKVIPPPPRALSRKNIEKILKAIPRDELRDLLLFRLLFETGLRISEALSLYVEDVDLTPDDERLSITGKGGSRRTVLLEDTRLVALFHRYLKKMGYKQGAFFRAHKNYQGGAWRYQSAQARWVKYCKQAEIECTLHQLRHSHATELVNDGVSLATIRKRLGHKRIQTTLRYAEQSDEASSAELRAWRRKKQTGNRQ